MPDVLELAGDPTLQNEADWRQLAYLSRYEVGTQGLGQTMYSQLPPQVLNLVYYFWLSNSHSAELVEK